MRWTVVYEMRTRMWLVCRGATRSATSLLFDLHWHPVKEKDLLSFQDCHQGGMGQSQNEAVTLLDLGHMLELTKCIVFAREGPTSLWWCQ